MDNDALVDAIREGLGGIKDELAGIRRELELLSLQDTKKPVRRPAVKAKKTVAPPPPPPPGKYPPSTVPMPSVESRSKVYFIGSDGRHVKIGRSMGPAERLRSMQIGSAADLVLLGTMPGGATVEQGLHERFSHLRLRGEWFRDAPELRAWIADHCLDAAV